MERRDLSGQVLDNRYRVIGRVGKGNMGSVYRAEDIKLGRAVAVKVINEQVPNEMAARQRFDREAKAMAKLEHPHCASVLDVGMIQEQPYVVMDFVAGQGLDELVAAGPLPIARAVEVTRQVLFGLAHAHEVGIIHRDIKPANIVLSQKSGMGDHAMILDFGLAKLNLESSGGANLTSGVVVGTPSYMAPEQIRGLLIDHRVDIYACGVLLFELLTGIKPFRVANNEPIAICMAHLNEPAPRLADVSGDRDFGALEAVVATALAKDRDHRFASANAFANALAAALAPTPSPILPAPKPSAEPTSALSETDLQPAASGVATMALAATEIATVDRISPTPATGLARADRLALSPNDLDRSSPTPPTGFVPPQPRRSSRRWLAIAGGSVLVVAVIVVVAVAGRDGGSRSTPGPGSSAKAEVTPSPTPDQPPDPTPDRPPATPDKAPPDPTPPIEPATPPGPPADDPVATLLTRAEGLVASGRREAAITMLVKARKTHPADGRLPYRAGLLYLERMWWPDGIKQLRAAIELDPSYKNDSKLIQAALHAFNSTAWVDWTLANFLRNDIGPAAKPYLEDAAKNHRNPVVRQRDAAELRRYP